MAASTNLFHGRNYLDLERTYPTLSNLSNLTQEASDTRPINYRSIRLPETVAATIQLISKVEPRLPRSIQLNVTRPLLDFLDGKTTVPARLIDVFDDIAKAILWTARDDKPTKAVLEFTSDLWDGFISSERSRGVHLPDYGIEPPIVKWDLGKGPYTYTEPSTSKLGIRSPVVNMPAKTRDGGLAAWVALAHEVTGHDLLHGDEGLLKELGDVVYKNLVSNKIPLNFANYWKRRVDETTSDILGVLNLGPSFAYGLIAYFRSLNPTQRLTIQERGYDAHPLGILRAYVIAYAIRYLDIDDAQSKSDALIRHINSHDLRDQPIKTWINERIVVIPYKLATKACHIVAHNIMQKRLETLENHSLCRIKCWNRSDEESARQYEQPLENPIREFVDENPGGYFASHVVAQAVYSSLKPDANIPLIFNRMIAILNVMHSSNEQWNYSSLYKRTVGHDFEDGCDIVEFRPYQSFLDRFYFQRKQKPDECTLV